MTEYIKATDVEDIAEKLIADFHDQLKQAKIAYLYRDKASKKGGRTVLGSASKESDKSSYLSGYNFVIIIAINEWLKLTDNQKEALIDHELSHCTGEMDEEGKYKWKIIGHDVEEFTEVLVRHGLWKQDLATFYGEPFLKLKEILEKRYDVDVSQEEFIRELIAEASKLTGTPVQEQEG